MRIDLHIHSKTGSDGALTVQEIMEQASKKKIDLLSITDHDSIAAQSQAIELACEAKIAYVTGVELNVTFPYKDKSIALDFLGYGYDIQNTALADKLIMLRKYRGHRINKIINILNTELKKNDLPVITYADMQKIRQKAGSSLGRPHLADYLVQKGIVKDRQQAFDKYLVKCNLPKYPLSLKEASGLIRQAGGILVHAHPADFRGTSLISISSNLKKQTRIIQQYMLDYIDGIECYHTGHDRAATAHYLEFAKRHKLIITGGTDCHQRPIIMGSIDIPDLVARQIKKYIYNCY